MTAVFGGPAARHESQEKQTAIDRGNAMGLDIIVMVKQVPDTHNVSGEAMKSDGTVNRGALPAIFNPEDLNALEEALKAKEIVGGKVTAVTMGPPSAVEVLRECLYRGADDVILLSDRRFAGADTLATSYVLACAVKAIGRFDLIFCGRRAIDGDTAQVGPQIAEKLGINQITCAAEIVNVTPEWITVKRAVENGYEIVKSGLPVLVTVTSEANDPRPPSARRVMAYKNIGSQSYGEAHMEPETHILLDHIKQWNVDSIGAEPERCGLSGSPTKVTKVRNVVLTAGDSRQVPSTDEGIAGLIQELIEENIIG